MTRTFTPDSDDQTLVAATRAGELAAFELLVRRHQGALYAIAVRLLGNEAEAEEVVQDAFLAAWRKLDAFRGEARFATWLTAILINQARSRRQQLRSAERRSAYSLDAPLPGERERYPDPPANGPSALERLETAELQRALQDCLRGLPDEYREVLVLRELQELPYDQVGNSLGLREGTVKSRLFRARQALTDCVRQAAERR